MRTLKIAAASVVVVLALLVFYMVLAEALWGGESGIIPPSSAVPILTAASSSLPVRLLIPTLGVNANVQYVGVNAQGNMRVPNNFTDVAWYDQGVVPGQAGSAVIDGHVDNGLALAGVFKHLSDIKIGDSIYIEDTDGSMLHFVVYDTETYPYKSVPMQTVFAQTDAAHLNLITCTGTWVPSGDTYDHRIVVYTKLVAP